MKTPFSLGHIVLSQNKPACRFFSPLLICFFLAPVLADELGLQNSQDDAAVEMRLKHTVEYLSSDELQGRGAGTEGIDKAADYIAKRLDKIGLKSDMCQGSPYQEFYIRPMHYDNENALARMNVFSYFGDTIYEMFVKFGELSPNNKSPKKDPPKRLLKHPISTVKLKNVVAMLVAVGPKAEETIVIGAHYDHLGVGKSAKGETQVYPGANDNASGVAVMLEAAGILAHRQEKLPRRIVFIAFSGEESGLRGSFYYVANPVVPLEKTIAMINLDVVGRMEGNMLMTVGTSTSPDIAKMTDTAVRRHELTLMEIPGVLAGSDHIPFYSRRIPVVFLLSHGGMRDMHQPSDKADTLNYAGMRKIAQTTADLAVSLAEADRRPQFAEEDTFNTLLRNVIRLLGRLFD